MTPTYLLAIETSCDETAAAVLDGPCHVIGSCIASQIATHAAYGGVVPEIAARAHSLALHPVVEAAMAQAGIGYAQLSALAVTQGPGLVGALLTGISYAKGLSAALGIPLVGVHHMAGHIAAARLTNPTLQAPYVALVVSGGHTHLIHVRGAGASDAIDGTAYAPCGGTASVGAAVDPSAASVCLCDATAVGLDAAAGDRDGAATAGDDNLPPSPVSGDEIFTLLGRTRDDAAGEAFDKAARVLHLTYPGGPAIDRLAQQGNPNALPLPRAKLPDAPLDFSFSGLKTALLQAQQKGLFGKAVNIDIPHRVSDADAAASFQAAVVDVLVDKSLLALRFTGCNTLVVAGGVAANGSLRQNLQAACQGRYRLLLPARELCTDNAAMIGVMGWRLLACGLVAPHDMDALPSWPLV